MGNPELWCWWSNITPTLGFLGDNQELRVTRHGTTTPRPENVWIEPAPFAPQPATHLPCHRSHREEMKVQNDRNLFLIFYNEDFFYFDIKTRQLLIFRGAWVYSSPGNLLTALKSIQYPSLCHELSAGDFIVTDKIRNVRATEYKRKNIKKSQA